MPFLLPGDFSGEGVNSLHRLPPAAVPFVSNHNAIPQAFPLSSRFFHASLSLHGSYSFPVKSKKRAGKADTARPFLPGVALGVLRGRMVVVLHNYSLPEGNPSGLPHARRCASRMKRPVRSLANTSGSGYKKRAGSAATPPARGTVPRRYHRISETRSSFLPL